MRYHFGLGVGHIYGHSEFPIILSTIDEVHEEPNTASGSQIPDTSVLSQAQVAASHSANPEPGSDEEDQSDVDSASHDGQSISLGSDPDSDTTRNEGLSDWDEELIAEEMYGD